MSNPIYGTPSYVRARVVRSLSHLETDKTIGSSMEGELHTTDPNDDDNLKYIFVSGGPDSPMFPLPTLDMAVMFEDEIISLDDEVVYMY